MNKVGFTADHVHDLTLFHKGSYKEVIIERFKTYLLNIKMANVTKLPSYFLGFHREPSVVHTHLLLHRQPYAGDNLLDRHILPLPTQLVGRFVVAPLTTYKPVRRVDPDHVLRRPINRPDQHRAWLPVYLVPCRANSPFGFLSFDGPRQCVPHCLRQRVSAKGVYYCLRLKKVVSISIDK